ncbi:MAG: sporulation protein YabP [Clostridia bacterium]|nr:sporulation protein YabP [Clostridia bacterium]MBR3460864.1 sporulation protein YabP [Clostridia bacterium]MBR5713556.1 sporulation protein YabP [Clostridia bacterium]MBR5718318.1 sporulation protein YabP [Clostridia bacterium]
MNELRNENMSIRMRSHCIHMDNRRLLSVTGVTDVGCFNEHEVMLQTEAGGMSVEGMGLHITKLDLDDGQVIIEGEISAIVYEEEAPVKRGSLLSRMFR